jgi:hypothetical protein
MKVFLTVLALIFSSDIFNFWRWSEKWEIHTEKSVFGSMMKGILMFGGFLVVILLFLVIIDVLIFVNE